MASFVIVILSLTTFSRFVYAIAHVRAPVWAILCCVVLYKTPFWCGACLPSGLYEGHWYGCPGVRLYITWNAPGVRAGSHSTWRLLDFVRAFLSPAATPRDLNSPHPLLVLVHPPKQTSKPTESPLLVCICACEWAEANFPELVFSTAGRQVWWQIPLPAEPSRKSRCLFHFRQYKQSLPP